MKSIVDMHPGEMAGIEFDCECGKKHAVSIDSIITGEDVHERTAEEVLRTGAQKVFLLADVNTYEVLGGIVEKQLEGKVSELKKLVFNSSAPLIPDEAALGRILTEIAQDTELIIAVGSGTINDLARFAAYKLRLPYIIVCTAPSMDGYASVVSPLIVDKHKKTFQGVYPVSIISDTSVMKEAPMHMLQSGFGDVVGKLTALCDWELARRAVGEYFCSPTAAMVEKALGRCIESSPGVVKRDVKAVEHMTEGLLLTGMAIGLVGVSRPASGAEHTLAHYWEIDAIKHGREHLLHGALVGVGTVAVASIYELLGSETTYGVKGPSADYVAELLSRIGAKVFPADAGISRELFRESILRGMEIRPRYTVLNVAHENGVLEKIADELTARYYG